MKMIFLTLFAEIIQRDHLDKVSVTHISSDGISRGLINLIAVMDLTQTAWRPNIRGYRLLDMSP